MGASPESNRRGLIVIHTEEQFEQARLALERRSPQALAAFILTLIHAPNEIGGYVHAFVMADDWNAAVDIVKDEIDSLRKGERDMTIDRAPWSYPGSDTSSRPSN
jgi:hypothetical protein